jgi:AAA domain
VKRVLITGMSGAGKSSLLDELAARGHRAVDTDYGDYFHTVDGESLWREDRISALLDSAPDEVPGVLFVQGTTRNQALFYPRFDHIVLLSAPPEVLAERLATRAGNRSCAPRPRWRWSRRSPSRGSPTSSSTTRVDPFAEGFRVSAVTANASACPTE